MRRRRSDRPNLVDERGEEDGGRAGVEIGQAIIIASSHLRNSSDRAGGGRMDGLSVGRGGMRIGLGSQIYMLARDRFSLGRRPSRFGERRPGLNSMRILSKINPFVI